jgi:hypothetical protein
MNKVEVSIPRTAFPLRTTRRKLTICTARPADEEVKLYQDYSSNYKRQYAGKKAVDESALTTLPLQLHRRR